MAKKKLKDFEVTLYVRQGIIVNVQAEDEQEAIQNAWNADFDDTTICEQLGWKEDGEPDVTEV